MIDDKFKAAVQGRRALTPMEGVLEQVVVATLRDAVAQEEARQAAEVDVNPLQPDEFLQKVQRYASKRPSNNRDAVKRPLLLQAFSEPVYEQMIGDHRERHTAYAERHGYDYEVFDMAAAGMPYDNGWSRLQICLDRIRTGKWSHVFWLDADCVVVDHKRDMRETLPEWASYAFTIHPYPIATYRASRWHWQVGQMYYRADENAGDLLEKCLWCKDQFANDQHAINSLMSAGPKYQEHLYTLYQSWNNTLHDERPDQCIVAAFHGFGETLEHRRQAMCQFAASNPFDEAGWLALMRQKLGN